MFFTKKKDNILLNKFWKTIYLHDEKNLENLLTEVARIKVYPPPPKKKKKKKKLGGGRGGGVNFSKVL